MHEWALAEAVVSTARKVAKEEKLSEITKIEVKMGQLQQIDVEAFEFALKEIIKPDEPLLKKAEIEFKTEKAILKCRVCGHQWAFEDAVQQLSEQESESIHFIPEAAHVYLKCPKCESPDFEIEKGRGVWIESIEGG